MKVTHEGFIVTLTEKDLLVWMAALRHAALTSEIKIIPWDACAYFVQHKELSRLTGYDIASHDNMASVLSKRN